jgi:hypothetical protein
MVSEPSSSLFSIAQCKLFFASHLRHNQSQKPPATLHQKSGHQTTTHAPPRAGHAPPSVGHARHAPAREAVSRDLRRPNFGVLVGFLSLVRFRCSIGQIPLLVLSDFVSSRSVHWIYIQTFCLYHYICLCNSHQSVYIRFCFIKPFVSLSHLFH